MASTSSRPSTSSWPCWPHTAARPSRWWTGACVRVCVRGCVRACAHACERVHLHALHVWPSSEGSTGQEEQCPLSALGAAGAGRGSLPGGGGDKIPGQGVSLPFCITWCQLLRTLSMGLPPPSTLATLILAHPSMGARHWPLAMELEHRHRTAPWPTLPNTVDSCSANRIWNLILPRSMRPGMATKLKAEAQKRLQGEQEPGQGAPQAPNKVNWVRATVCVLCLNWLHARV